MNKTIFSSRWTRTSFVLALLLLGMLGFTRPAAAATLPPSPNCDTTTPGAPVCSLWATTGFLNLPGVANLPFWGYAASAAGAPEYPGPALVVNQGDSVTVLLTNNLSQPTSLRFEGQSMLPDVSGVAPGGTQAYTFVATNPGTFLYEAGPLPGAVYQPALGLFGALVVRPAAAANQAFNNAATAFDDEALVVLSEIDPLLHSTTPWTFDMRKYKARYWLINGKAYPDTAPIASDAGRRILLRYVNAGQQPYTMSILGMKQTFLSLAGSELPNYRLGISQLLRQGHSMDAIAVVPVPASAGMRFPFYEAGLLLHNNGAAAFGGMLTFIDVAGTPVGGDTLGPAASALALAPNPTSGAVDVALNATLSDVGRGDNTIAAAEYFIDTIGASGTGSAMAATDGGFDTAIEAVNATLLAADVNNLTPGNHTIYVHGLDAAGNWGTFNTIILVVDKLGPTTSAISQTPAVSNGSLNVAIQATGSDAGSGNGDVVAAEFTVVDLVDNSTFSGVMILNQVAPTVSLSATIPAIDMATLAEGDHSLSIRSQDGLGNWGAWAVTSLRVDQSGPTTTNVRPTPVASKTPVTVRVDADVSDTGANITTAELFIGTVGAPGSGLPLMAVDGLYNEAGEAVYGFIPQAQINSLGVGHHTIYVRGKDAAGNWGTSATTVFTWDNIPPVVSGLDVAPNPAVDVLSVTLTGTATDALTPISAAEWFRGTDPGVGLANPMQAGDGTFDSLVENLTATIDTTFFPTGNNTLSVRARDLAGNWSAVQTFTFSYTPPDLIFQDGFELGLVPPWSTLTGAPVQVTTPVAGGSFSMAATVSGNTPAYVTDIHPVVEDTYHARFYFNPNGTLTGNGLVEIFSLRNAAGTTILRVQYRRVNAGGGTYQVRLQVLRAGGLTNTSYFNITNNAFNYIEVDWTSSATATVRFYVNNSVTPAQTLSGLNTSAYLVETATFGPSAGLVNASSGTMFFDNFISRRYTFIGAIPQP